MIATSTALYIPLYYFLLQKLYSFKMKPSKRIILLATLLLFIHIVYADETPPTAVEDTFCEGATAKLTCPAGTVISIQLANYGRFSVGICNPNAEPSLNVNCHNDKTQDILKNRCQHKSSCDVKVNNEVFGDACPDTSKYLEFRYICVPPPATTTTTTTTPLPTTALITATVESKSGITSSLTSSIPTSSPKFCQPKFERDVQFHKTERGTNAKAACPVNTYGQAEWFCSIEGKWEGLPDLSNCVSIWTKNLDDDIQSSPEDSVVQFETMKELYVNSKRHKLVGGELIKVSSIIEKVVYNYVNIMKSATRSKENHHQNREMNKFLIDLINHLLSSLQENAWMDINDAKQRSVASKLLDSSEKLLASIFSVIPSSESSMTQHFYASPNIRAYVSTVSIFDYVSFPYSPSTEDVINIPKEALEVSGEHNGQVVYSNIDGLERYLQPLKNPEQQYSRVLASKILTASVVRLGRPEPIHRIARPVLLSFHTDISPNLTNPQCVWWNSAINDWSGNGCSMKSYNGSFTICECSHLTHFAILMDVRGIQLPVFQEMILTVITYVGCLLSIICLLLSFGAFFIFSDKSSDRNAIHMNLSLTLAIAEIVFLFGIYRTSDKLVCTIVGAVLQYFFLSAFCWMAFEGLQLYFMLVQVFSSKHSRQPFYYIGAYGFPAIISAVSFYWNPQGFGTDRHCWLSTENYFIWTFVGPASAVLLCNLLFLLMTFCIVCKHSNVGYKPCKHDYDTIRMIRAWLKGSFALIFLLGLTWTLGFFWIDQKTVWVAYVFTVFNTLQGVCIFVFHIWLNDKIHSDYENWVRRNDWLPSCLRDPTLNIRDRRTGPYVPSTATSSAHTGTSDSSNGSDGMNSQSLPRKSREYNKRPRSRTDYDFSVDGDCGDPLLYTAQCPNCSHSTTILYSATNTLRRSGGDYSEKPLPEAPCDETMLPFYTSTPKRAPLTAAATINYPGQQWTLDRFGNRAPKNGGRRLYNPSLKEAMGNGSNYQQQPPQQQHQMSDETYDYATIPYDDGTNKPYSNGSGSTQFNAFRTNFGVDLYPNSNHALNEQQQQFPRPPPNFKPPPPPQISGMIHPVSDDSAYSDSGASSSRSPNSVSRNGTMLLRMDLTKNPPVFVEDV